MSKFNVVDRHGKIHALDMPPGCDGTVTFTSSGSYTETGLGTYYLREADNGTPFWDFHPAPWVQREQRLNELRRDVLAYLDADDDIGGTLAQGRELAERIRKEHW